ncbi:MAG: cyanoglobin [Algoriphagus sp.]|uniref:globin domain-containing protein n=1 Tax=Algoriphagus sp. TaxID=1872435 RepID=UPI00261D4C25|nr:cyanoglobin [Algoriphagus sp.]MDG1276751.1 cyanoglobin [Algoriphagus sp.]
MNPFQSVFELIGADRIKQLTSYFYEEVASNPELRELYPEDMSGAEERLYLFLLQVFGGPQKYSEQRGHPRLRMRHLEWEIDSTMRNHWLNAMFSALDKLQLEPNVKELMMEYFIKVANHLINHE